MPVPVEGCNERLALSKRLSAAMAAHREIFRKYELAKKRKAADVLKLHSSLNKARSAARVAMRAFNEHIEAHDCLS
jgi:hypothetical protein